MADNRVDHDLTNRNYNVITFPKSSEILRQELKYNTV
jgi:hypothetical protein